VDRLKIYKSWKETSFILRKNRFTLLVEENGKILNAYLPNTGRMEEYLVEGSRFFLTPIKTNKFKYRAVATYYQDSFIFLDTIKINSIVWQLILANKLPGFNDTASVVREYSVGDTRIDFMLKDREGRSSLVEVKTCTLCHNGVAMFPDAPSQRACRHLDVLQDKSLSGWKTSMIFLIPNRNAKTFMPNFHTDYDFARKFMSTPNVCFNAFKINFVDPVTVDLDRCEELKIDRATVLEHCTPSGSYAMVIRNDRNQTIKVGRLGEIPFKKGYYLYIGSALRSVENRVKRHGKTIKSSFWHIDFIVPGPMKIEKIYIIRRRDRIESKLVKAMMGISEGVIRHFGATDSDQESHLLYFADTPVRKSAFITALLDFKTFSDGTNKYSFP
jgi:sugar fermentation stimulation protein A